MLCQDQALCIPSTPGREGRVTVCRAGIPIARRLCFNRRIAALILVLGPALLAAGCMRFTYGGPPTAVPDLAPSPASTLTSASATPLSESQDETQMPTPTVSGPPVLRIEPSVADLAVGETCLVQVWLDNVDRLHSIELHIGFESRYVRIEDADPGTAGVQIGAGLIPVPVQVMRNEADNGAGLIVYQVAGAPGSSASGSGMVASFTAQALAEGGTPLRFSVVNLRDPGGQLLGEPEQVDGLVVVGAGTTAPESTAVLPPRVTATPVLSAEVYHTVQPGENLFRIALRYGTTVGAIVAANNLPSSDAVQAGQVLLIPVGPPASTSTYVVQPGDTLYSIAHRFDTTVETLAALNGLVPPYMIEVGQVLIVTP